MPSQVVRQWSFPASAQTSTVGDVTTVTPTSSQPGFILGADQLSGVTLITAPPNSASVFAPASYTAQTASVATVVQNTLGYDAQFVATFQGSASVATFQVGTGTASPPTPTTVATLVTGTNGMWTFPAVVPAGYYYSFQVSQANAASVPSGLLTIVAYPV